MPYKNHADFVQWNRNYQRQRAAQERAHQAELEGHILKLVEESPGRHDLGSLYQQLQPLGFPLKAVKTAMWDLVHGNILEFLYGDGPDGRKVALCRWLIPTKAWQERVGRDLSQEGNNAALSPLASPAAAA